MLICISCGSLKSFSQNQCIENEKFKETYFSSINKIEQYVLGKGDRKSFQKSLKFIAKYSNVSYDKMLNYNNSYTKYEDYERDKTEWLKWYERNKCSNLK